MRLTFKADDLNLAAVTLDACHWIHMLYGCLAARSMCDDLGDLIHGSTFTRLHNFFKMIGSL